MSQICPWSRLETKTLLVQQIQRATGEITFFIMYKIILPESGFQPHTKSMHLKR